jgi:diaminopimelate decarboxylase
VIKRETKGLGLKLLFEIGRMISGNAGILVTQVVYVKHGEGKTFVIVDAAMNDLIRPTLYEAHHDVKPVAQPGNNKTMKVDVVGPVCETGDFLGKQRQLTLQQGSLLAVFGAGAYGFSMSSNYNSRPRAAEVMVDGAAVHEVRARETLADLLRLESRLPA